MTEPYFAQAKIGDEVTDLKYGDGVIEKILTQYSDSLEVVFKKEGMQHFFLSGKHFSTNNQTLFYRDCVEVVVKPRPKRKVKKTFWLNVYTHNLHKTEKLAKVAVGIDTYIKTVPVEIEVEE